MAAAAGHTAESEDGYSYIRNALTFIYGHYEEAFSVRELASHCCISESHLRRLFKNMVGISPLECLQHYRIQQACHLIHLNQKPVNSIARQVGYVSLSSFNRQFQQYMHMSPSEWKKEHLSEATEHEVRSYEDNSTRHIFQF